MEYKNNRTGEIVEIINLHAAGMGDRLLGRTLVVYKPVKDIIYGYPFVMDSTDFDNSFSKVDEGKQNNS